MQIVSIFVYKREIKMRIEPNAKYNGIPCSYVGTGCAYENITGQVFNVPLPGELHDDGYLSLDDANRFIRKYLSVQKKVYYKRSERFTLREFLKSNEAKCCVCVYGHFIYVNGKDYWSFFDNEDDKVVCIWFLRG